MEKFVKTLVCGLMSLVLVGCGGGNVTSNPTASTSDSASVPSTSIPTADNSALAGATRLSFKDALSFDYLKSLDKQKVAINGYMATSSPVDGSFIFLMNLPYQSCPFCKPNTSLLSNTIEAFPKQGKKFSYTTSAITIIGTLEVANSETEVFTDAYGYQFAFKIVDSDYMLVPESDMDENTGVWQKVASSNLITDVYSMLDYINFVCYWPTYFVKSYTDIDGNEVPGFYLYAADALNFLNKENGQYHYGRVDGYFQKLINRAKAISETALAELIKIISDGKTLADYAYSELENGNYTATKQYVEKFGTEDYIFTLNNATELESRCDALYESFASWLGNWEL